MWNWARWPQVAVSASNEFVWTTTHYALVDRSTSRTCKNCDTKRAAVYNHGDVHFPTCSDKTHNICSRSQRVVGREGDLLTSTIDENITFEHARAHGASEGGFTVQGFYCLYLLGFLSLLFSYQLFTRKTFSPWFWVGKMKFHRCWPPGKLLLATTWKIHHWPPPLKKSFRLLCSCMKAMIHSFVCEKISSFMIHQISYVYEIIAAFLECVSWREYKCSWYCFFCGEFQVFFIACVIATCVFKFWMHASWVCIAIWTMSNMCTPEHSTLLQSHMSYI